MAFATTIQSTENRGTSTVVRGTWTCAIGDAAGTFAVAGSALSAEFRQNKSTGPVQYRIPVSGLGTATVTVYHLTDVTGGAFEVEYK